MHVWKGGKKTSYFNTKPAVVDTVGCCKKQIFGEYLHKKSERTRESSFGEVVELSVYDFAYYVQIPVFIFVHTWVRFLVELLWNHGFIPGLRLSRCVLRGRTLHVCGGRMRLPYNRKRKREKTKKGGKQDKSKSCVHVTACTISIVEVLQDSYNIFTKNTHFSNPFPLSPRRPPCLRCVPEPHRCVCAVSPRHTVAPVRNPTAGRWTLWKPAKPWGFRWGTGFPVAALGANGAKEEEEEMKVKG